MYEIQFQEFLSTQLHTGLVPRLSLQAMESWVGAGNKANYIRNIEEMMAWGYA